MNLLSVRLSVRPDVDIEPGPLGFGPNAVPLSTVAPIELHEKLVAREDMPGAACGLTWVDFISAIEAKDPPRRVFC
ncbi:hypothetical protein D3C76_752310 [compost metagenome]